MPARINALPKGIECKDAQVQKIQQILPQHSAKKSNKVIHFGQSNDKRYKVQSNKRNKNIDENQTFSIFLQ